MTKNPLGQLFPSRQSHAAPLAWPNEHADRGFIICFTGRCGSTELVDVLCQSKLCGLPDEYFNEEFIPHHNLEWQSQDVSEYMRNLVVHRSLGRTFGFKIDGFRHRRLSEIVDPNLHFPKSVFKFFYLTRRNLLEQSFSYASAKASGVWHVRDVPDAVGNIDPGHFDITDRQLWEEFALILEQEFYFERYFIETALNVQRLDYEMMCASKTSVIADVMLALGCSVDQVGESLAGLKQNFRKLRYDGQKDRAMIEFRHRYAKHISYLTAHRGRLPFASVRNYLYSEIGIDLSKP
ncbi:MAG: Stf0 family sulfotransferase [Alphaproteobacteria bacterium]|nr:Stf0 family sulfotransferase [Alphaproteobacteria bacterium]